MHTKRIALTVFSMIAIFGSHLSYSQNVDVPETFAEAIGGQIADIVHSVVNARQVTRASSEQIESARQQYFACYPDCPDLEARKQAFSDLLAAKDYHYFSLALATLQDVAMGGNGQNIHAIGTLAGAVDGGIYWGCAAKFDTWTSAVYGGMGGGIIATKMDQLVQSLQGSSRKYQDYVACRDKAEFAKHFGLAESSENPKLTRSALIAVDRYFRFQDYDRGEYSKQEREKIDETVRKLAEGNVQMLMCEYGPFENTTGSITHKPYRIMEAWYKSPPPNLDQFRRVREHPGLRLGAVAMACCPETSNGFFAARTGKGSPARCEGPPPSIKSSFIFWAPRGAPSGHIDADLIRTRLKPDGSYVCTYENGETETFEKGAVNKVYRGKCPLLWYPVFAVDYEILDSGDVRYALTNGESLSLPRNKRWTKHWVPDERSWWRFGDPEAQ